MEQLNTVFSLENAIVSAVQLPGVKVDRSSFLRNIFAKTDIDLDALVASDPIQAGVPQDKLMQLAKQHILSRTTQSSFASFAAGIPGGLALAATIPADLLQFFGFALRLAQELAYLYGGQDLWSGSTIDDEKVRHQLILYCGVMFGVSGAVSGVRLLTAQLAKTTLRKLPQKALTKTFWYPVIKQICKAVGVKVTKTTVARGISKMIPLLGGVISGGLNFASMLPMAERLLTTLDDSCFGYTIEEMEIDLAAVEYAEVDPVPEGEEPAPTDTEEAKPTENPTEPPKTGIGDDLGKKFGELKAGLSGMLGKKRTPATEAPASPAEPQPDAYAALKKLAELKDLGILTQEEFDEKKSAILKKL